MGKADHCVKFYSISYATVAVISGDIGLWLPPELIQTRRDLWPTEQSPPQHTTFLSNTIFLKRKTQPLETPLLQNTRPHYHTHFYLLFSLLLRYPILLWSVPQVLLVDLCKSDVSACIQTAGNVSHTHTGKKVQLDGSSGVYPRIWGRVWALLYIILHFSSPPLHDIPSAYRHRNKKLTTFYTSFV